MSTQKELKDKVYVLKRKTFPISFMLASRNTRNKPLLYFDSSKGLNRALRYAVNQKSPFEDEQDGNFILEPIIFEDGLLAVNKYNQVLQQFLEYHPDKDVVFEEVDTQKDASNQMEIMYSQLDAQLAARDLDINTADALGRVLLGTRVERLTTEELRRDLMIYARNHPREFMNMLNDPELKLNDIAVKAFQDNTFMLKNKKRDIYFNLPDNKNKLMGVPFGEDPVKILASWLQSNDGLEVYELLSKKYR